MAMRLRAYMQGRFTHYFRHDRAAVPCQIYRLVAIEVGLLASPCHRVGPKNTMGSAHGDSTSIKGDAMRFQSRDGRAAQTGKETAHLRSRPRSRGLASHDHLTLNQARPGQRHRAGPTYLAQDSGCRMPYRVNWPGHVLVGLGHVIEGR